MWCLPNNYQTYLEGTYNTQKGSSIFATFTRCQGQPHCKSVSKIDKWIEDKLIYKLENV